MTSPAFVVLAPSFMRPSVGDYVSYKGEHFKMNSASGVGIKRSIHLINNEKEVSVIGFDTKDIQKIMSPSGYQPWILKE